ncbi:MAG: translocation/assembly module TamB [Puniceicoccales bacterium]|jgi:translocation and assembly module TamB|nr:translocation/assembly module TamB [Puniceicoccales bacterium]
MSTNQIITGNLFFTLIELLFKYPFAGRIQVDTVTIGGSFVKNIINSENSLHYDKFGDSRVNIKRIIWALKSPIFHFSGMQIKKIQIEGSSFSIENIRLDDSFLSGELLHRDCPDLRFEFNIKMRSLRKALQAWLNCADPLKAFWAALDKFKGAIHAKNVPISMLMPNVPLRSRPQGMINSTLTVKSGKAYGNIELLDIETRTVGQAGGIHDLQCRINFDGDTISIEGASAKFRQGGMSLTGTVSHKRWHDFQFNLHASGSNAPLFHKNGAMFFGDIDFSLVTDAQERGSAKTTLSGNVNFLPSQWYAETVKPKKMAGSFPHSEIIFPKDWNINISLSGDRFLRINMPYFHGVLSAQATIYGTTGAPVIHGQGIISQGVILFPFARFRITHGNITLDPSHFTPIWDVDSESRLYNYSLRLRLFGEGFTPTCTFSSSPTLPNGAIINMITSGRMPGNKVGTFFDRNQASVLGVYLGSNLFGGNFADRVRIQMGQDICDGGKDTIEVEFIINNTYSVIVERDRHSNSSADMKIRIF